MNTKEQAVSDRRRFFKQAGVAGLAGLLLRVPELFAEELIRTPEQTEGPYYPTTVSYTHLTLPTILRV